MVTTNRKAKHKYNILDQIECGMQLTGSEVKALREGNLSIDEGYIRVKNNNLYLVNADVGAYNNAGAWNHEPRRDRKLLVHAREFEKFADKAKQPGLTLVPLQVYFNQRGIAKCVMGLAKGKQEFDKRQTIKKRESDRGLARLLKKR